jgi:BolA protein
LGTSGLPPRLAPVAFAPWRKFFTRPSGVSMSAEARIRETLMLGLRPLRLDVINESELHAGHRSSPGTGESHFRVVVVADSFKGRSRLERHRMVNDLLAAELRGGVHALAIKAYAPGEEIR